MGFRWRKRAFCGENLLINRIVFPNLKDPLNPVIRSKCLDLSTQSDEEQRRFLVFAGGFHSGFAIFHTTLRCAPSDMLAAKIKPHLPVRIERLVRHVLTA